MESENDHEVSGAPAVATPAPGSGLVEHTPGPWWPAFTDTGWCINARDGAGPDYIADVHLHVGASKNDARSSANATLIAAAPELLEALKSILEANLGVAVMPTPEARAQNTAADKARAAIAKACGQNAEASDRL